MSNDEILDWIRTNVTNGGYAKCREVCQSLQSAHPDTFLLRKGQFNSIDWGLRNHWWLIRISDNQIVDPTAEQFPDGFIFPFDDLSHHDMTDFSDAELEQILPSGRCAYCGNDCYGGDKFCSDSCCAECIADLNKNLNIREHQ